MNILKIAKLYKGELLGADNFSNESSNNLPRSYFAICASIKASVYKIPWLVISFFNNIKKILKNSL